MIVLDLVLASIAECPRTADEVAHDIRCSRVDVAKAIATLTKSGRVVRIADKCPETGRYVYEPVLPVLSGEEYRREQFRKGAEKRHGRACA